MKTRILILLATAFVALSALATTAPAATSPQAIGSSSITVTPIYGFTNECFIAPDQMQTRMLFRAKIKRTGRPKPKLPLKVKIRYTVTDLTTSTVLITQTLNLKPRKYRKAGALFTMVAGHNYQLDFTGSFRVRETGQRPSRSYTDTWTLGTAEQLAAAMPACPPAVG